MIDFSNFKEYDVLLITCDDNSKHVVFFNRIEENGLYSFCGTDTDKEFGIFGNARFADFEDIKSCELAKQEDIEILYDELILYFKNNPPRWNRTFVISETHIIWWLEEFCNLCFWDEDEYPDFVKNFGIYATNKLKSENFGNIVPSNIKADINGLVNKDAFIDMACKWIEDNIFDFPWYDSESEFTSKDIADEMRKFLSK